ncbi:MAG: ABC transporter permease, partial [Planctomycetota bacterium]|nr:ABC transporter permease [Planctomycetota bacterium]
RNGFTAGALMSGLALMVAIWTQGAALLRDWIGAIDFPDAFVHSWRGMTPEQRQRIEDLPFVEGTAALTMQQVGADAFGIRLLQQIGVNFIAFEPDNFFAMTRLSWIEGDPETAKQRLEQGGAILVAREFTVARDLHLGDTFTLEFEGEPIDFEIAGVVTSPGLDIASRYFDIGETYANQALHAVFGTRADLIAKFNDDSIDLLQLDLADDVSDEDALATIRRTLGGTLLVAGSGREIKQAIDEIGRGSMRVMSALALAAILIACFGVGNVVVAGIDARRYEFGVLRAVGAAPSLLARLILAEVLLIAITACILGAVLGVQASATGILLYEKLAGLTLNLRPPPLPIAAGCAIVITLALASAALPALTLVKKRPRELLTAPRG